MRQFASIELVADSWRSVPERDTVLQGIVERKARQEGHRPLLGTEARVQRLSLSDVAEKDIPAGFSPFRVEIDIEDD